MRYSLGIRYSRYSEIVWYLNKRVSPDRERSKLLGSNQLLRFRQTKKCSFIKICSKFQVITDHITK